MQPKLSLIFLVTVLVNVVTSTNETVRICVTSQAEENKCQAIKDDFDKRSLQPQLGCKRAEDKYDCFRLIADRQADVISVWPSDAYIAGKNYDLIPILAEKHTTEPGWPYAYYSIVVVKKRDNTINSPADLRGKRSCHTGVNRHVGWLYPKAMLNRLGLLSSSNNRSETSATSNDAETCSTNPLADFANFFNGSCASNANNPAYDGAVAGSNDGYAATLCSQCGGSGADRCSDADPYADYTGAFKCLVDDHGDVAFVKDTTWAEVIEKHPEIASRKDEFQLLCVDGSRKTLDEYVHCNWGRIPEHVVVTSPDIPTERVERIRNLFVQGQRDGNVTLFESEQYGGIDLIFDDHTKELISTEDKRHYRSYLGDYYDTVRSYQHTCDARSVKWCTVSIDEFRKCIRMRDAFTALFIQPEVDCVLTKDSASCLDLLKRNLVSILTLDSGDIYEGGKQIPGLKVILNEDYGNGAGEAAKYWAVAVVKKSNIDISFNNLRGKKSCHTGIGRTAGWKVPVGTLISTGQLPPTARCDLAGAVGRFFGESCVPGALTPKYNRNGTNPESLCSLCNGTNDNKCSRSEREPFYGYSGAFRCLATDVGDVAFVKHVTVSENTDGANQDEWARHLNSSDFELLCTDGSRKPVDQFASCNLAKVPSHAVVVSPATTGQQVDNIVRMLRLGQQYYGAPEGNECVTPFKLFSSGFKKDLLFTDATKTLKVVPEADRGYRKYLDNLATAYDHLTPSENLCEPSNA